MGHQKVMALSRSMVEPFLTFCDIRDLQQEILEAWISLGERTKMLL